MPRELLKREWTKYACLFVAGLLMLALNPAVKADIRALTPADVSDPILQPCLQLNSLAELVVDSAKPIAIWQVAETAEDDDDMDAEGVFGMAVPEKYKGKPISLDFKDIDVLDVFVLISEVSGFNVVVDPDVKGRITIRLENVPWDQALEVILKNQGLGKEVEGNVMRIANMSKLRDENVLKRQMAEAEEMARPRDTRILYLSYAKAVELEPLVRKVLSRRGEIIVDERTNAMIVVDIPENLEQGVSLIRELDVRTKQVSINAQVVNTTKNFARNLGIQWGGTFAADKYHGNTTGYRFPNNMFVDFTGEDDSDYAVNLPSGQKLLSLKMGNVLDTLKLQAALSASENEGMTKVISNPRVTTADNTPANVESGYDIPYSTVNADTGAQSVAFISASLRLSVTPHITNDRFISMEIEVTKNQPDFANTANAGGQGTPIIKNVANTRVLVKDGETVVIGGLNETSNGTSQSRIPWLGRVPIIGLLFKNHAKTSTFTDLLYFITPTIIQSSDETIREGEIF